MSQLYSEPQEILSIKERVKASNAIFSWESVPPRHFRLDVFLVVASLGMSCFWGFVTSWHPVVATMMCLVTCSVAFFLGVTAFQPHHYHYELTREGIRVKNEERIPEIVFTIIRCLAWFGVIVCLIAVAVVGPMAFVGAGAAALGAFKFTGFKKKASHYVYLFHTDSEIRYFEKGHALGVFPLMDDHPDNNRNHFICDLYVAPEDLEKVVSELKQVLNISEVKYVECSEELDV